MLNKLICMLSAHIWSPEDFNEVSEHMDLGDAVMLRCHRCGKNMVTIEKTQAGLKWTPHDKESVIYEVTEKGKKLLATENLKKGAKKDLDKFREDFK